MGALTIKPLAFKVRPWELTTIEITNFVESYNGKIAIQKRGNEIIRILPTRKDSYYWISDNVRFVFESLKKQRISYPYLLLRNKYIKINWQIVSIFLKYFIYFVHILDNINSIEQQLKNKNNVLFKNLLVNKNAGENDLISNLLLNSILSNKNLIKYESIQYLGNINQNFYTEKLFTKIKATKYHIINNLNIISDYPRIWLLIKNSKILLIGIKKNLQFLTFTLNNTNHEILKIEKSKSILGFFKEDLLIYTENLIQQNNLFQIVLNKSAEKLNNFWINNKKHTYITHSNIINWSFLKNKAVAYSDTGINLNFLTHGIEKNQGFNLIFPITTFLEEYSLRLDNYGTIQKTIPVNIRGINMRNFAQILLLIQTLSNNETPLELKILKDILVLKYGLSLEEYKTITNFIFKNKKRNNKKNLTAQEIKEELLKHSNVLKIKNTLSKKNNNF